MSDNIDYKKLGKLCRRLDRAARHFRPAEMIAEKPFDHMYYARLRVRMLGFSDDGVMSELDGVDFKGMLGTVPSEGEQLGFLEGYYDS